MTTLHKAPIIHGSLQSEVINISTFITTHVVILLSNNPADITDYYI